MYRNPFLTLTTAALKYELRCASEGASCATGGGGGWGSCNAPANRRRRAYECVATHRRRRTGCGDASKVIFKTSPWIDRETYDAQCNDFEGPGFDASGPTNVTKTYAYAHDKLKGKYCSEVDSTMFESGWCDGTLCETE